MMNAIDAHKDELERLLVNLLCDTTVSGVAFVALLDTYITRLDTKLVGCQRKRRYGAGGRKRIINMEPTLTQNCALYFAQHTAPKRRASLFRKFRTAAHKQTPSTHQQITRDGLSKRLSLYRDNGR
jgi:hypothetical protein